MKKNRWNKSNNRKFQLDNLAFKFVSGYSMGKSMLFNPSISAYFLDGVPKIGNVWEVDRRSRILGVGPF
jgi:hypothetical protein